MTFEAAKQLWIVALAAADKHQANLKKAQFASATRNVELETSAWEIVAKLEAKARETMGVAVAAALQLGGHEMIPTLIAEAR
jgi:cell division protein FtsL